MSEQSEPSAVVAPRTYLGWSLAATVLCFLPLGIVALVLGLRVDAAVRDGRVEAAARESRRARLWLILTVVVGVVVDLVLVLALLMLGAVST